MIAGDSLRQALQLGRAAEELEAIFTDLGRAVTGFSAALRHGLLRLAGGPRPAEMHKWIIHPTLEISTLCLHKSAE